MSKAENNKAIVGRWFTEFWGKTCNLGVVDDLAAPDMLLQYSLHEPRRGRDDIKAFMTDFRRAFPDLNFWGTADLIAEGDYVVGQWEGGGTHTGPAFSDFLMGSLPPATGRKMHFTGTTLRIQNGKTTQEIGLEDGVKALTQLGLIKAARPTAPLALDGLALQSPERGSARIFVRASAENDVNAALGGGVQMSYLPTLNWAMVIASEMLRPVPQTTQARRFATATRTWWPRRT